MYCFMLDDNLTIPEVAGNVSGNVNFISNIRGKEGDI